MASIRLTGVVLDFPIYGPNDRSFRRLAADRLIGGARSTRSDGRRVTRALADVNLSLDDGDRLAIVGPNGAGKSSLLKVIAGIYEATSGARVVDGDIATLFDIYHGMLDDMSGASFVMTRCLFRGMQRRDILARMEEVREFS